MTADWNVQLGMSCGEQQPRQIFMKDASQLLLYAKQLVTEMMARDSRIIRECAQQASDSNFRVDHYEQVPVLVRNTAPVAAQPLLGVGQQKEAKGRGGPLKQKFCAMCGEAMSQGGEGGKRRNVGKHDCK